MLCGLRVKLAQFVIKPRTNIFLELVKHIRPWSGAKCVHISPSFSQPNLILPTVQLGIAPTRRGRKEGFIMLIVIAAALMFGKTYRSSRNQFGRQDIMDDQLEKLSELDAEMSMLLPSSPETRISSEIYSRWASTIVQI